MTKTNHEIDRTIFQMHLLLRNYSFSHNKIIQEFSRLIFNLERMVSHIDDLQFNDLRTKICPLLEQKLRRKNCPVICGMHHRICRILDCKEEDSDSKNHD